jgi:imidazolonepropionase-like amidohydrolase
MSTLRSIGKWFLRFCLLVILSVALTLVIVHVSRAYYLRQAQQPPSAFIVENAPVIALIHARVIDGTGARAQDEQTLILTNGTIADVGPTASLAVPADSRVINLSGKTVFPGLVMLHEHLFTTSPDNTPSKRLLVEQPVSFPLLYLGSGVTTMRTTGSIDLAADIAIKRAIDSGRQPGPDIILTAPYLEGQPMLFSQMHPLANADEARRAVDAAAAQGVTWFKAYMHITPEELQAAIDEAHIKGLKITGHLCSVGFTDAADMGIDGLEHGIMVDTEFFPGKQPGICPEDNIAIADLAKRVDIESPDVQAVIHHLIEHHVTITSTLAVDEDFGGDPQPMSGLEGREQRALCWRCWMEYLTIRRFLLPKITLPNLSAKQMRFEREFAAAGGTLVAGSDPTGDGGTVAGYADQREIELLVKAGFSPVEAIHIATQNGAEVLAQSDRIGSIANGKQADLVVVTGDPSTNISDIRNVDLVFRKGVGYSSAKLFGATKGLVGVE